MVQIQIRPNPSKPFMMRKLEGEELEHLIKALEQLGYILGIEDSIDEIIIKATDAEGEPYLAVFKWDDEKGEWWTEVYW